jgi:hypothetical protein
MLPLGDEVSDGTGDNDGENCCALTKALAARPVSENDGSNAELLAKNATSFNRDTPVNAVDAFPDPGLLTLPVLPRKLLLGDANGDAFSALDRAFAAEPV